MPLNKKGKEIMKSMKDEYGKKKGEQVFYASKNKGTIKNVEKAKLGKLLSNLGKKVFGKKDMKATPQVAKKRGNLMTDLYQKKTGVMQASKGKMLKAVPADKQKSLGKLPTDVRNKMGYAKKGTMMKAAMGMEARGYGAARQKGMGLQDENLIPGKSLDYYSDIMD